MARGGGAGRNSVPGYDFPAYQVVNHRLLEMPLRTSALRSLGAFLNVFAAESFMDELAARPAGPGRVPAVLPHRPARPGRGRGGGPALRLGRLVAGGVRSGTASASPAKEHQRVCAVVAEVSAVSEVRVRRLTIAVNAGLVINPDGAANQVEGGAIQAVSWALKEQVRFDRYGVTSDTWERIPCCSSSGGRTVDVELRHRWQNHVARRRETARGPAAPPSATPSVRALGVR